MQRAKHPTYVSIVFELLKLRDDFLTKAMIQADTRLEATLVNRSLTHLRSHRAVDAITVDGVLWWYATPHTDTRLKVVKELAHFTKSKRRMRQVKAKEDTK